MPDFTGRNVMITGAAGGIGQGLCAHFLASGATVLAIDVDADALSALAAGLAAPGLHLAAVDLTDAAALARAVDAFAAAHGHVAILINNAGAAAATALANLDAAGWAHDLQLNLTGAYNCVEATKHAMFAAGGGVILNIGTVNALTALGHPA